MQGPMPTWALTVDRILEHAASARPHVEIFTSASLGAPNRSNWGDFAKRVRRLSGALAAAGVRRQDVVAVIGSNTVRQLEAWYAIMGLGAVCHPLSPALPPDRLAGMLRSREHKVVFIEPALLGALEPVLLGLPRLERVVALAEQDEPIDTRLQGVIAHDAFLAQGTFGAWEGLEESAPALMTHPASAGEPARAVTWSHRSCVLQAMSAVGPNGLDLSGHETILPLVPFWRAAAWGLVFAAPMAGAKLVLPGRKTDSQSIRILADREAASLVIGAPAELQRLHDQFRTEGRRPNGLQRVIAVGAPCPVGLVKAWRDSFGVDVRAAWGLAETSSVGTVFQPGGPGESPPFGLELEITSPDGRPLPHDGAAVGRLKARGASIAGNALGSGERLLGQDGLLDTGDLASIDPQGRVQVHGRADALVFAGPNLVPAEVIEAVALEHPATAMAAAIDPPAGLGTAGPVLVACLKPGATAGKAEYLRFLSERLDAASTPKDVLWVDGFPLDAAGRVDRPALRERLERLSRSADPAPATIPEPLAVAALAAEALTAAQATPEPAALVAASQSEPPPVLAAAAAFAGSVLYRPEGEDAARSEPQQDMAPVAPAPEAPLEATAELAALTEPPSPLEDLHEPPPSAPEPAPQFTSLHLADEEPPATSDLEASPPESSQLVSLQPESSPPESSPLGALALPETEVEEGPPASLRVPGPPPEDIAPYAGYLLAPRVRRHPLWADWFLSITALLAAVPLVMVLAIAIGLRFGLLDWRIGLGDETLDWPYRLGLVGLVGGLLAIFAALFAGFGLYWRRVLFSLFAPMLVIGGLIALSMAQEAYPPLHDVATDWKDPLTFGPALLAARGSDANPVEPDPVIPPASGLFMNRRVAEVNADTCPAAHAALLPTPPAQAYLRAKEALATDKLMLVTADPASGSLEATATNPWLGTVSDVAVRIRATAHGSRVDLRSVSRLAPSDFGTNCALVGRLVRTIEAR